MAEQQKNDGPSLPGQQDLPRSARRSAIARLARRLTPDEYRGLHAALDGGTAEDRHTALFLATVRRDLDRVVAALHDPALRSRALAAAGRLPVPDEALAEVARTAPQAHRLALYRQLRRTGKRELADRLLPEVYDRYGRREAARLLVACSPETVHPWFARLAIDHGVLAGLARTAPVAVARLLAEQEQERQRLYGGDGTTPIPWNGSNRRLVTSATRRDPEAGFHLLATAWRLLTAEAVVELLAQPARVAELIRSRGIEKLAIPDRELPTHVARAIGRLPEEQRVLLARTCRGRYRGGPYQGLPVEPLLALLEPELRAEVAAEMIAGSTGRSFPGAGPVMALGPEKRAELVRTHLAERPGGRASRVLRVVRLLPLAEAEERLARAAGSPRRHERADGWGALLACATVEGDPAEFARIVRLTERAWHDHPEVRQTVLQGMTEVPARLLAAVPTEVLRDATLTVAQARDATARCLEPMAGWLRLTLRRAVADGEHPRVAELTGLLAQLAGHARFPVRGEGELGLPVPVAEAVWEGLHATAAMRRPGRWLRLAALLPPLPRVDARLEEYLLGGDGDGEGGAERGGLRELAAGLWLRSSGGGREERCGQLVSAELEFVRLEAVWQVLARNRTDLLAGLFAQARRQGFAWAPPLPPGAGPQAAAEHTALVGPAVSGEEAEPAARAAAARVLTDPGLLREAVERGPQPVAAAALRQLARVLPPGEALPSVVPHLGGGGMRGRAAALAVRHLLARSTEAEAEALLTRWLADPAAPVGVGAGKELVGALGDLSDPVVLRTARAAWDAPGLHRDVRARIGAVLTGFLDRPEVAARLLDALGEPAVWAAVSEAVGRQRDVVLRPARERFLSEATAYPDPDVAEGAYAALHGCLTAGGPGGAAAARELVTFGRPGRIWRAAVRLIAGEEDGRAFVGPWTEAVDRLALLANGGGPADGGGPDDGGPGGVGDLGGADGAEVAVQARRRLAALVGGRFGPEVTAPALLEVLVDRLESAGLGGAAARTAQAVAAHALVGGDPAPELWSRVLDLLEGHPLRWTAMPEDAGLRWDDEPPEHAVRAVFDQLRTRETVEGVLLAARLARWITDRVRPPDWWEAELVHWLRHPDPDITELMIERE
ncbi:hypothetical protein ACIA8O_04560 [Kitasatospora sp. NPDC051853]|uniref:hypothetical protein n=1 Tax=Kitasatospora sp. NPDC051853 TaxID=3364058 RepID=UPI0037B96EE6